MSKTFCLHENYHAQMKTDYFNDFVLQWLPTVPKELYYLQNLDFLGSLRLLNTTRYSNFQHYLIERLCLSLLVKLENLGAVHMSARLRTIWDRFNSKAIWMWTLETSNRSKRVWILSWSELWYRSEIDLSWIDLNLNVSLESLIYRIYIHIQHFS